MYRIHSITLALLLSMVFSCETQDSPIPSPLVFSGKLRISENAKEIAIIILTDSKPEYYSLYRLSVLLDNGKELSLFVENITETQYKEKYYVMLFDKSLFQNAKIIEAGALLNNAKGVKLEVYNNVDEFNERLSILELTDRILLRIETVSKPEDYKVHRVTVRFENRTQLVLYADGVKEKKYENKYFTVILDKALFQNSKVFEAGVLLENIRENKTEMYYITAKL